jgi:hypothetical protein
MGIFGTNNYSIYTISFSDLACITDIVVAIDLKASNIALWDSVDIDTCSASLNQQWSIVIGLP